MPIQERGLQGEEGLREVVRQAEEEEAESGVDQVRNTCFARYCTGSGNDTCSWLQERSRQVEAEEVSI